MSTHKKISIVKSWVRIIGYACFMWRPLVAVIVLILAEVLGILEEAGEK